MIKLYDTDRDGFINADEEQKSYDSYQEDYKVFESESCNKTVNVSFSFEDFEEFVIDPYQEIWDSRDFSPRNNTIHMIAASAIKIKRELGNETSLEFNSTRTNMLNWAKERKEEYFLL